MSGKHSANSATATIPVSGVQAPRSVYDRQKPPKKRHTAAIVVAVVLVLLVGLAVAAGIAGSRLYASVQRVQAKVSDITPAAAALVDGVKHGDTDAIQTNAQTLIDGISQMREETDGTLWQLAERIPSYGEDVKASRELVSIADDAMKGILTPALPTLVSYPKQSLYGNGSLNGDAIKAYCNLGSSLSLAVSQLSDRVGAVHAPHLNQINEVVEKIDEPLAQASGMLSAAAPYLSSLPDVLGCYSDRTYLVLAQNPSEVRSTGGYFGAMAPVLIHNGSLSVGEINGVQLFEELGAYYYTDLSDEEGGLFTTMGVHIGNLAAIPDYSKAATAVNKLWTNGMGMSFDGIIALDPTVLQDLVGLFGDVGLSNGMILTGTNTAKAILHDSYQYYEQNEDQDLFFAEAAFAILDKIMDASLDNFDVSGLLDMVQRCMDERRLLVWMSNPTEQALMDELGCTGRLFDDPTAPTLGVYLNDSTWSKFAWWLTSATYVGEGAANSDGTVTYPVTTVLGNAATWDEVYSSTRYVTGFNGEKRDSGDMLDTFYLFAPMDGSITDIAVDDGSELYYGSYGEHAVVWGIVHNEPGETRAITYNVTVSAEAAQPLQAFTTPTAEKIRLESY